MSLQQQAEAMLAEVESQHAARLATSENAKHGNRLTKSQIALILQLDAAGKTGLEIAHIVGCGNATVSRTLDQFKDSRELARKRLEGGAVRLAQTVVNTKDAAVALKALGKLDVVREDQAHETNIAILMGSPDTPLSPPAITAIAVSPVLDAAVTVDNTEAKATPIEGVSPDNVA